MEKRNILIQRVFCLFLSISLLLPYAPIYAADEPGEQTESIAEAEEMIGNEAAPEDDIPEGTVVEDEAGESEVLPAEEKESEEAEKEIPETEEACADEEVHMVQVELPDGSFEEAVNIRDYCLIEDHTIKSYDGHFRAIIIPDTYWDSNVKDHRECSSIAEGVFKDHTELEEVYFAGNTGYIGRYAFSNTGLKKLTINYLIQGIDDYAFSDCKELEEVEFLPIFERPITNWGVGIFQNCPKLKKIKLSDKVRSVPKKFATQCPELEEVIWPANLTRIDAMAFRGDEKLKSSDFSETSLTFIGEEAFGHCSVLPVPKFPSMLESIGYKAFLEACTAESVTAAPLTIPGNVKTIGADAFLGIPTITELIFEANKTASSHSVIEFTENNGAHTFKDCTGIKKIVFSDRTPNIPSSFAEDCTSLETVVWPANLARIDGMAFRRDEKLKSSDFSETSLKAIGSEAFAECPVLPVPKFPSTLNAIGSGAFRSACTDESLTAAPLIIPYNVTEIGNNAFGRCGVLEQVIFEANVPEGAKTSITFYSNGTAATFGYCKNLMIMELSDRITEIPSAFTRGCDNPILLKNGTAVTSIGGYAFLPEESGLHEIVLINCNETVKNYNWKNDRRVVVDGAVCVSLKEEYTVTVGESLDLKPEYRLLPEDSVMPVLVWTSSSESYVTVSDGRVKGIKEGSAYVNVATLDGIKKGSCKINVVKKGSGDPDPKPVDPPAPVPGSGEATDPQPEITTEETQELTLVVGQKFNAGKGWSTKDTKLLSVNKKTGAVKAKKAGTATMSHEDGAHTISVTIVKPSVKKSTKLEAGATETLTVPGAEGLNILWCSSAPDIATVNEEGLVTAVAKGSAKITAWVNGSAYKCSVKVTETTPAKERTLHLNVNGGSKTVKIKGLTKPEWKLEEGSEEGIVEILSGKKIKGKAAGTVTLVSGNGEYKVDVTVEDPTIVGSAAKTPYKKTEELNVGGTASFKLTGITQDVVFKSSKSNVAFVSPLPDEDGKYLITARGKGTAKLTAKVNGKSITITVKVK